MHIIIIINNIATYYDLFTHTIFNDSKHTFSELDDDGDFLSKIIQNSNQPIKQ